MLDDRLLQMIRKEIKRSSIKDSFVDLNVPFHKHTGVDSPSIDSLDINTRNNNGFVFDNKSASIVNIYQNQDTGDIFFSESGGNSVLDLTISGFSDFQLDVTNIGFFGATPTAQNTGWTTFLNLTPDKTCDANATTVAELADILGTLIEELKAKGLIAA